MKKYFLLISFLFISGVCEASQMYAVERDDGGISIVTYEDGSKDSLADVLKDMGLMYSFDPHKIYAISKSDLPADRADRRYWKLNKVGIGPRVLIDTDKKQADIDRKKNEKILKKQKRDVVLGKLNITESELKDLNENTD